MVLLRHYLLTACFVGLVAIFWSYYTSPTSVTLVIGILSARNHFVERTTIRSTWMKQLFNYSHQVKAYFIVGNRDCDVPLQYRLEPYSCQPLELNRTIVELNMITGQQVIETSHCHQLFAGLSFTTNWDIVVKRVGGFKLAGTKKVVVSLHSALNDELIMEWILHGSPSFEGYIFHDINPAIRLPKGFWAFIKSNVPDNSLCANYTARYDESGLITYLRLIQDDLSEANLVDGTSSAVLEYAVADIDEYKQYVSDAQKQYEDQFVINSRTEEDLLEEMSKHDDMLIIDSLDVYRNLPIKLLKFIKYVRDNLKSSYLMKTDDDCYLNINLIMTILRDMLSTHKLWWGKENWALDAHGKWAEHDYRSVSYPLFACGSGSIISDDLAEWLAQNAEHLHPFQGEDVSMGIWMAPLLPNYSNDSRWLCTADKDNDIAQLLAIPQLDTKQMHELDMRFLNSLA